MYKNKTDLICVDGEYFDPYHILQVTFDDADELITKSFKTKVKKYHPDKAPQNKRENYSRKFKIVMEAYNYIRKKRGDMRKPSKENYVQQELQTIQRPTDFGYGEKERIKDPKEYDRIAHELRDSVVKQIDGKFDADEFNTIFEYAKTTCKDTEIEQELSLIHKTTDGFWGYNSSNVENCALVSSFNGLMLTGDTFGEDGVGYWGENYSDYQRSFGGAKNPSTKLKVPKSFTKRENCKARTTFNSYLDAYGDAIETRTDPTSFVQESDSLFEKAARKLEEELETDKKKVMKYAKEYYTEEQIEDAIRGRLDTSPSLIENLNQHYNVKRISRQ